MMTSDQWVLLWSCGGNEFTAKTLDSWVSECRGAYTENAQIPDLHPVVIGSQEECVITMDACKQTIKSRQAAK